MNSDFVEPVEHFNCGEEDKENDGGEHVYAKYRWHASQLENLFHEENSFWPDCLNEVGGAQVPNLGVRGT